MTTEANPPVAAPSGSAVAGSSGSGAASSSGSAVAGSVKPPIEDSAGSSKPSRISEGVTQSTGSFELVFSVAILALAGFGLDSLLGWRPILTVTFAVAGAMGAVASLYFRYREAMRQQSGRS